jgi:hypothetical protein
MPENRDNDNDSDSERQYRIGGYLEVTNTITHHHKGKKDDSKSQAQ